MGEIFCVVAKLRSIRFLLNVAATFDLVIEQMDVKTTFLDGDLKEEIYTTQPKNYTEKGKESLAFKLKKYSYGLKQSPRMWFQKFDSFVLNLGFLRSKLDHCVYYKYVGGHFLVITLYVDDMLSFGNIMFFMI